MKRMSRAAVGALLATFLMLVAACEEEVPPLKLQVGAQVPPLAVQDLRNQPVVLQPSPQKLLMINIWATWCGPCRHEMPSLQRMMDLVGKERLELVGLSVDDDEHVVREYLIENKIRFPSLLDRDMNITNNTFGVRMFPSTFFVGPDGRLLGVVEGWRDWDSPELIKEIGAMLPQSSETPTGLHKP